MRSYRRGDYDRNVQQSETSHRHCSGQSNDSNKLRPHQTTLPLRRSFPDHTCRLPPTRARHPTQQYSRSPNYTPMPLLNHWPTPWFQPKPPTCVTVPATTPPTQTFATQGLFAETDSPEKLIYFTPITASTRGTLLISQDARVFFAHNRTILFSTSPKARTRPLRLLLRYDVSPHPDAYLSRSPASLDAQTLRHPFHIWSVLLAPHRGRLPRLCPDRLPFQKMITLARLLAWGAGGQCLGRRFLHLHSTLLPATTAHTLPSSPPSHNMCPFLYFDQRYSIFGSVVYL